ncbi:MAG: UDP-N-acetylmuramate dehydrogenase [Ignavibacteria bacterium]|jgi:UDP-N-acetylmuramate dehydrogenase
MDIIENQSLFKYNTFNINVIAKYFTECCSIDEIKEAIEFSKKENLSLLVIGDGSNILFTKDYNGIVVKNNIKGIEVLNETGEHVFVQCGAGEIWDDLVNFCVEKNYGGIENLSLIPGTAGAAPIQNIGAYGVELKDVFYSLDGVFLDGLKEKTFSKNECEFGYRKSIFKSTLKNEFIITGVVLKLSKYPKINIEYSSLKNAAQKLNQEKITIKEVSELIKEIRRSKLPDTKVMGNAGSFFKNPEVEEELKNKIAKDFVDMISFKTESNKYKIPAGWLIEKCGLKGMRFGDTGTYDKQALVLVNHGKASGKEIFKLAEFISKQVYSNFNIKLEIEVNII